MSDDNVHTLGKADIYAGKVMRSEAAQIGGEKLSEVDTDLAFIAGTLRAEIEQLNDSIAEHGHLLAMARGDLGRPMPPVVNPTLAARSTVLHDYLRVLAALELSGKP